MLIRLMWVFPFTYGPRYVFRKFRGDDPLPAVAGHAARRVDRHARAPSPSPPPWRCR